MGTSTGNSKVKELTLSRQSNGNKGVGSSDSNMTSWKRLWELLRGIGALSLVPNKCLNFSTNVSFL